jgi:hypothetical protein
VATHGKLIEHSKRLERFFLRKFNEEKHERVPVSEVASAT